MRIYLAGCDTFLEYCLEKEDIKDAYILESFYSLKKTPKYLPFYKDFLLDSGAFSFFGNGGKNISWDDYVTKYINFINKYNIKHFFELDIDVLTGYDYVKEIRKRIEKETGKQCIPVFHKSRGIEEYKKLCEEYKYIAIGCSGKHDSVWTRKYPEKLYQLVMYAKSKGVKVHGLGYTKLENMSKIPFYSVDSTSWLSGNRFGHIFLFNGKGLEKRDKKSGQRLKDAKDVIKNNFHEWKKYQNYADLVL